MWHLLSFSLKYIHQRVEKIDSLCTGSEKWSMLIVPGKGNTKFIVKFIILLYKIMYKRISACFNMALISLWFISKIRCTSFQ